MHLNPCRFVSVSHNLGSSWSEADIPYIGLVQYDCIFTLSLSIQSLLHFSSLLLHTRFPSAPAELPTHTRTRSCGGCRLVAIVTRPKGCRLQSTLDSLHKSRIADLRFSILMLEQGQQQGAVYIYYHTHSNIKSRQSVAKIQNMYLCVCRVY